MPMVSESSQDPDKMLTARKNTQTSSLTVPAGRHRSQTGYRSRRLSAQEEESIRPSSDSGHVVSLIDHYEKVGYQYARHHSRANSVNDRLYTELNYTPAQFTQEVVFRHPTTTQTAKYHIEGIWAITAADPGSIVPALPPSAFLDSIAGKMMRQSVPRPNSDNLVRFAAEQRDAPALFKSSNYVPKNIPEAAGAYLNYVFGIKPTKDDLLRMAETVIRADHHIKRVVRSEKVRQRSSQQRKLSEFNSFTPYVNALSTQASAAGTISAGPVTIRYAYLTPFNRTAINYGVLVPAYSIRTHYSQSVRQFATWEYFVPMPQKIETRLARYKKAAENLIGEGASAGTVWNLTPWTWLTDWFVDFGGLLHYQQAVADNQVVATTNGYSIWEEMSVEAELFDPVYDPAGVTQPWLADVTQGHAVSTVKWRRHKRQGGNPYAIGPTWTGFSPQQWAILAALGVSHGGNVPIHR